MVREKYIRCEKYIVKGGCNVGWTEYLGTFFKSEKGVTDDELDESVCASCNDYPPMLRPSLNPWKKIKDIG